MYRNLNAECARLGVTQKYLAEKVLNITPSTLSIKLKDPHGLKLIEAKKIKEFLHSDLPIDELFQFDPVDSINKSSN